MNVVRASGGDNAEREGVLLEFNGSAGVNVGERNESEQSVLLFARPQSVIAHCKRHEDGEERERLERRTDFVILVHGDLSTSQNEPSLLPRLPSLSLLHQIATLDGGMICHAIPLETRSQQLDLSTRVTFPGRPTVALSFPTAAFASDRGAIRVTPRGIPILVVLGL